MTFTNKQVRKAIKEVVAEVGKDHVYEGRKNTPHKIAANIQYSYEDCIVGCVIRKLEPELHQKILDYEKSEHTSFSFRFSNPWRLRSGIDAAFTDDQQRALRQAQAIQDAGETWGKAQIKFKKAIGAKK